MDNPTATSEPDSQADTLRRAAIDRSVKGPVLFLFLNGAFWLMASTLLGVLAAVKSFAPEFLEFPFLSFGRVQPAHLNALVYGWGVQAALGVMLWITARRTGQELRTGKALMIVAGVFWNITVTLGLIGILFGGNTSMEWLEMPAFTWPVLLACFLVYAIPMVRMFARAFRPDGFLISLWYIVGACLWFPWIYITANVCLHCIPSLGAMGAGVNAWYVHALILLFFVPVAIGSAYYFIPKITGQPIASFPLASLGFWLLAVIAGWTGMQRFMGGPLPAWMVAVGAMAAMLLLIPTGIVGLNQHLTTLGKHKLVATSPTLRFTFFGAIIYPIAALVLALISNFWSGFSFQFSHAWYGYQVVAVYGFASMCIFGAMYYIVPRLAGCEWLSVRLIRNHFWFSVYGVATIVVTSLVAGVQQASDINTPERWDQPWLSVVLNARPYLVARAVAWALITWSNIWFLIHLVLMVAGLGRRSATPTLLPSHDDDSNEPALSQAANA
jgi:cytochrome c oxidase cbb3-type subunit 1